MTQFNRGDRVTVVQAEYSSLNPRGIFTVASVEEGMLRLSGVKGVWAPNRFALLQAPELVATKATNPKEAIGDAKLNLSLVPDTAHLYLATAFTEGALKYGSYNWRSAGVRASTYVAACRRHMAKWWNGEDFDPKTKVHHLANAMACLAIVLDAEVVGKLNDDRPPKADMDGLIQKLELTVTHLKEMSKGLTPHHHTANDAE